MKYDPVTCEVSAAEDVGERVSPTMLQQTGEESFTFFFFPPNIAQLSLE